MKRHLFLLFLAIPILAMLSFPAGCNKPTGDKNAENGNISVKQQGGKVDVELTGPKGGKLKIDVDKPKATLPNDFPKDIPIPPGTELKSSVKLGKITTVTLETTAPVADILDYYKKTLAIKGWKVEPPFESASGTAIGATKPGRTINLVLYKIENTTVIKLTL